jgi:hypothetical protein
VAVTFAKPGSPLFQTLIGVVVSSAETHHEVVVRLRIVVAPAGLSRPADVLVPQAAEREAERLVGESVVDRYLEVPAVCHDALRRAADHGQSVFPFDTAIAA